MAVGKNFLENLTVAMYENSFTVYREYIQNSADSIDKAVRSGLIAAEDACIDISIEYNKRKITVFDNACGIPMHEFKKKMTDVADSDKDRDTEKGFRGIGRLAGLGYCDRLLFRTTAKGEDKESVISWDGNKLREIVNDPEQHPTSDELITEITSIEYHAASKDDHYFQVIMEDVIFESDDLLDEKSVIQYLQSVAPAPYPNYFIFGTKIHDFARENGFTIDEYTILVNSNQIFKPYKTYLCEGGETRKKYDDITDVEFKIFKDKTGTVIAWLWYGITKFEKCIPVANEMRCIRLRKENIQIGDENAIGYPRFFKEARGNGYFVGELFAVDKGLIPNARRDYFNPNPEAKQFEESVHYFFYQELNALYHYANKVKSAQKAINNYQQKVSEFNEKDSNSEFIDNEEREAAEKELEEEKERAQKAEREILNRQKETEGNEVYKRVFSEIKKAHARSEDAPTPQKAPDETEKKKPKYITQKLSKYSSKEQKLIARIYAIIKGILPKNMADLVVEKIQEELSK